MNLAQTQSVTLAPKITSAKTLLAQQDEAAAADAVEAAVETPAEEAAPVEAVEALADEVPADTATAADVTATVVEEPAAATEEAPAPSSWATGWQQRARGWVDGCSRSTAHACLRDGACGRPHPRVCARWGWRVVVFARV